jgi:acyl-CoA thioesterase-2
MRAKAPLGDDIKMQQAALRGAGAVLGEQGPVVEVERVVEPHGVVQAGGLVRGQMYGKDGRLVASVAQECLMRVRK